jgi:hypothetical protein
MATLTRLMKLLPSTSGLNGWHTVSLQNTGVASRGVFLNLPTLTATLKDQYLQTQIAIWPVANKTLSFSSVHKTYLERMKSTSERYAKASDAEKPAMKKEAAKQTWRHITRWAKKLHHASATSKNAVAEMTAGIKGVSQDLRSQIKSIRERITRLKKLLECQKGELESIKTSNCGLWSFVLFRSLSLW